MKKFIYILAAAMLCVSFAGCNKSENTDTEAVQNAPVTYTKNDFAIYTLDEDSMPSKFLCMLGIDKNSIDYGGDENAEYISDYIETQTITVKEGDMENPGKTIEKEEIRYIYYKGTHEPIVNVKGIKTTGIVMEDDKCSKAEDVIKAYKIDKETEGYIESKMDDGSYIIRLNFKEDPQGNIERIKSKPDADLNVTDGRYSIRFNIINDHVHGYECYMYY